MTKKDLANQLNISKTTLERRQVQVGYILSRGLLCPSEVDGFMEKLHEWEQKRHDEAQNKKGEAK